MTAKRVSFQGVNQVGVVAFDPGRPGPGEVLVRTRTSLISTGTELATLLDKYLKRRASYPSTAGYSNVGEVCETGEQPPYRIGEVLVSMSNHATHARLGREWAALENAFPKPPETSDEEAAFAALGGVAMHGIRKAAPQAGETVAVFGLGLVGQLCLQLARAFGGSPCVAVDLSDFRLEVARAMGADLCVNASREDAAEKIMSFTGARGAEVLIESSGTPHTLAPMLRAAAPGARLAVIGGMHGLAALDLFTEFQVKELTLLGCRRVDARPEGNPHDPWVISRERKTFLRLVAEKRVNVAALVTHRFPLDDAPAAYRMLIDDPARALGVILTYPREA